MEEPSLKSRLQATGVAIVVVLLCGVFILQFGGPQAEGCTQRNITHVARVYGDTIGVGDHRAAMELGRTNDESPSGEQALRIAAVEGLIERSLLARKARALGMRVTDEDVWKMLAEDGSVWVTMGVDSPQFPTGKRRLAVHDESGSFDPESARLFIQNALHRSVAEFAEAQAEEMLAQRMRELVASTVELSPREVWDAFVLEKERVTLKYIRFARSHYTSAVAASDADVRAWMAENTQTVDREYEANRHRYVGLEPQVRARHILIKAQGNASDEEKSLARARAEALLRRVRAGEDFATLAREQSEDEGSARMGGDLGYNPRGRMVPQFDEAQFALAIGAVSDVIETQFGFHIVKVEAKREGDVPIEEAKREIAEGLYRDQRGELAAATAARDALAALRGAKTLDELDRELGGAPPAAATTPEPRRAGARPQPQADASPPRERDPLAPHVEETRPFGRTDSPIAGLSSGELVHAAFELTTAAPLPSEPLHVGNDWLVIRLESRTDATRESFTQDERTRLHDGLLRARQREVLVAYLHALRREAERDGAIRMNQEALTDPDPDAPRQGV